MTQNQLALRAKANIERYVNNDAVAAADAMMELHKRMPDTGMTFKSLFRYRKLDQYELESLKNSTIFMRWPSSYEDQGDCTPVIDYEEVSKYILRTRHPGINAGKVYTELVGDDVFKENPKLKKKIAEMRDMWVIACFTERYNNDDMWTQYADESKGFCLVYDFMELLNAIKSNDGMSIMPVRYVDDRENCADITLNHEDLLGNGDAYDSKYHLTCTTKDKLKYSFEEEWRLILERPKTDADENAIGISIPFATPTLIICGELIDKSSSEFHELMEIATEKDIIVIDTDGNHVNGY